jgi:hypothetical protein
MRNGWRHVPFTQFCPAAHVRPQAPQLSVLVLRFTQVIVAPQAVWPAGHNMRHVPVTQLWPPGHARPHIPQLVASLWRSTQRPGLPGATPQMVAPAAHVPPHTAAAQVAVPPTGAGHVVPQRPQLFAVVLRLVSQPLAALPSQSPKPVLQVRRHAPVVHAAVWFGPAVHVRPHAPQLVTLVLVLVSQPLAAFMSQLPKPAVQVSPQVDIAQVGVEFAAGAQARPQAPQFAALVVVSMQVAPQSIVGAAQAAAQTPIEQFSPAAHARPHIPQFVRSVCVSTQTPPQEVCPAGQRGRHMPPAHVSVAPHTLPQRPQLFVSVSVSMQTPPQAVCPTGQSGTHVLIEHRSRAAQVRPQAPQLVALDVVSTHAPPQRIWPAAQGTLHAPALQVSPAAQTRPHAPQLAVSACVSTQVPAQFKRPAGHIVPASVGPASAPASAGGIMHAPAPKPQPAPVHVPSVEPAAAPERQRPVPAQKPQPAMAVHDPQSARAEQGSVPPSIPPSAGGITTSGRTTSIDASVLEEASPASRPGFDGSPQAASAAIEQQRVSALVLILASPQIGEWHRSVRAAAARTIASPPRRALAPSHEQHYAKSPSRSTAPPAESHPRTTAEKTSPIAMTAWVPTFCTASRP